MIAVDQPNSYPPLVAAAGLTLPNPVMLRSRRTQRWQHRIRIRSGHWGAVTAHTGSFIIKSYRNDIARFLTHFNTFNYSGEL